MPPSAALRTPEIGASPPRPSRAGGCPLRKGDGARPQDHGSDLRRWQQQPAEPGRRFAARAARCLSCCLSRCPSCCPSHCPSCCPSRCPSRCRPSQLGISGQTLKNPSYSRHAEEAWLQTARMQQHTFLPGRAGRSRSKPLPKAVGVEAATFQESSPRGAARCRQPAPAPDPGAALGGSCWEAEQGHGAAARAGGGPFLFSEKGRNAALCFALLWLHGTGGPRCFPKGREGGEEVSAEPSSGESSRKGQSLPSSQQLPLPQPGSSWKGEWPGRPPCPQAGSTETTRAPTGNRVSPPPRSRRRTGWAGHLAK